MPRVDLDSYDPITKHHKSETFTAKSTFKDTLIWDSEYRKKVFEIIAEDQGEDEDEGGNKNEDGASFIDDNMNKWPVIVFDLHPLSFLSSTPSDSEIHQQFCTEVIYKMYKKYDYILLIKLIEQACLENKEKGKSVTREDFQKFMKQFQISSERNVPDTISQLWDKYGDKLDTRYKEFYRFYAKEPPYTNTTQSLSILVDVLSDFYKKEVIVLVDEHDTPLQHFYKHISLSTPERNAKIMGSINSFTEILTDTLKKVAKQAPKVKKFLMFGITNTIVNSPHSRLNNIDVCSVFNSEYAEFFSMTHDEMTEIIDDLFEEATQEIKGKIMGRIKEWYNGYF